MRAARFWFLLLLAVMVPLRGAVAAVMLCPVGNSGLQSEPGHHAQPKWHEAMDQAIPHDHADGHDHAVAGHGSDGHDHPASDKCNLCSAFCSLTPLVSHVPTLVDPLDLTAVKFAEPSALPPSFVPDGQERPPRTI